jgi:guanosine-3',5'-bis(diphosphate) 3'-pyrophosphohydrolase
MNARLVLKAAQFAALKHKDQLRKGSDELPYIVHLISTALLIAEVGGVTNPEILAAALLHDTIEDTETTPEELTAAFGEKVCRLVEEVSDDKSLEKAVRKRLQIEHAPELSPEAVLIKLADKISNVTDLTNSPPVNWDLERRKEYIDWAEKVIKNCPEVNSALEKRFAEVLALGRRYLLTA